MTCIGQRADNANVFPGSVDDVYIYDAALTESEIAYLAGNGAALLPDALAGPGLILPMALPVAAWLLWRWLARRKSAHEAGHG